MEHRPVHTTRATPLADLLDDPRLGLQVVHLPPRGEQRAVTWVHATEQVDPRPHLRPDEFVCTLGSSLVSPSLSHLFVRIVAETGCAAVGLGLGEVHSEAPPHLVEQCREFAIPLVTIRHEVPFLAINDALLRSRELPVEEAQDAETELLAHLLRLAQSGADPQQLLEEAATALTEPPRDEAPEPAPLATALPGTSAVFRSQFDGILEWAAEERERQTQEYYTRVGQLIDLVEHGLAHPAALKPELDLAGLTDEHLQVSAWPAGSERAIRQRWPEALIAVTRRTVLAVMTPRVMEEYTTIGLVFGISSPATLSELRRALSESNSALALARHRGVSAGPRDLVTLDALLEQTPNEVLSRFVDHLLAPIIAADGARGSNLVETLRTYIACGLRLQHTADTMHLHVNTLRNRLRRIAHLSGRDPLTADGIYDLKIALWAADKRHALSQRLIRPL